VTILAYGQTGSGKTFTIEGPKMFDEKRELLDASGILPRTFDFIFKEHKRLNL